MEEPREWSVSNSKIEFVFGFTGVEFIFGFSFCLAAE
jgi:hypothetical protein